MPATTAPHRPSASTDHSGSVRTGSPLYLRLFVAARRFCAGERTHLFW
ncbi:hypothetical protein AB0K15_32525 [Amycolatopsis sp. NPDC049253]